MKRFTKLACAVALAGFAAGCATTGTNTAQNEPSLPDWVMNPTVEGGIAATDCVRDTGNFSIDRAESTAKARAALAQQINLRVQSMDKTYMRSVTAGEETDTGGTFESVSRQVADEHLSGSRPLKVDYVRMGERRNLCVLVALDPAATKGLFDSLVAQSNRTLSPTSERALYEEFRAFKAQEELNEATR